MPVNVKLNIFQTTGYFFVLSIRAGYDREKSVLFSPGRWTNFSHRITSAFKLFNRLPIEVEPGPKVEI